MLARPVRRAQQERRRLTRDRLINAAIAVLGDKGFEGLRGREISSQCGVTWGAVQHLFGDKNELLRQVVVRVSDRFVQKLDADAGMAAGPLRDRVAKVVNLIWSIYSSPEYFAMVEIVRGTRGNVCLHGKLVSLLARLSVRIEELWLQSLPDARAAEARSLLACNLVVLALSGLASRQIYLAHRPQADAILPELIDRIAASLSRQR